MPGTTTAATAPTAAPQAAAGGGATFAAPVAAGPALGAGAAASSGAIWRLHTSGGQSYGPVTKDELDRWFREGRIDAQSQVYQEGWPEWKWATEVYPELAVAAPAAVGADAPPAFSLDQQANPFVAPMTSNVASSAAEAASIPGVRAALAGTRPWVLFLSILGFISCVLMALFVVFIVVISTITRATSGIIDAMFYIVADAIALISSIRLWQYAQAIGRYLAQETPQNLRRALDAQQKYWMFLGIMAIIAILLLLGSYAAIFVMEFALLRI